MAVQPHVLRRYILERANGRSPRHEWAYYAPDLPAFQVDIHAGRERAVARVHHGRVLQDRSAGHVDGVVAAAAGGKNGQERREGAKDGVFAYVHVCLLLVSLSGPDLRGSGHGGGDGGFAATIPARYRWRARTACCTP